MTLYGGEDHIARKQDEAEDFQALIDAIYPQPVDNPVELEPDPTPYLWILSGGRTKHGSRWGSRPGCRFAPREGYSQNPDDYI